MTDGKLILLRPVSGSARLVLGDTHAQSAPAVHPPISGKLIFLRPASGSAKLVLGDSHPVGTSSLPNSHITLDAEFEQDFAASVGLAVGVGLRVNAAFEGDMPCAVVLAWDANVHRGGIHHALGTHWQQAQPKASAVQAPWQQAQALRLGAATQWQAGQSTHAAVQAPWQQAQQLRHAAQQQWQAGQALRHATRQHWQEAVRLRTATVTHWQQAQLLRHAMHAQYQETLRLRATTRQHWQNATSQRASTHPVWGHGIRTITGLHTHWQPAMRPLAGVSPKPSKPPKPVAICYDPARLGLLVVDTPAPTGWKLLFVCRRPGTVLPPAAIVVPAQRTYIMINSIEIRRADNLGGDPLPSESFSMSLNRQSWTWQFSAAFHASARDALTPGAGGQPVELEVRVNNQPFRLQAERIGRSRKFGEHMVTVSGRGKAAVLDAPHAPVQTFSHTLDRTAHQLMTEVLTVNGVGFGWSVDWNLTDWLVPGGVWMHQGTFITALADIAASVGGYLQPHDTDSVLRVLPSWPKPWWDWGTLAPDIELPDGIAEVDDTEVVDQPAYDRIFVSGEARGVLADLTRSGLPGTVLKQPMAVHPLITSMDAARQRAIAELSESGRALKHRMTLPVLPQTGVITPGMVLRYVDDDAVQRLGIVRATNLQQQWPVLTQTLELDSHV